MSTFMAPRIVAASLIAFAAMTTEARTGGTVDEQRTTILEGVVTTLLLDLKNGTGDKDRRRQVEEWMRTLAEKYPEFSIEAGLRDYYLAEAGRLSNEFQKAADITEKLNIGRSIESFLDRAAEYDRRIRDRG
jgi:hypothetical protein